MQKGDTTRDYSIDLTKLHTPTVEELANVIKNGLSANFKTAECSAVECPDLSTPPFGLAAPGLCGKPRLAELGGVPYLIPTTKYMEKVVQNQIGLPGAFMLGAGAGSKHIVGCNCELMPNVWLSGVGHEEKDLTHISKVNTADGSHLLHHYKDVYKVNECTLMCNLFCCEGKIGGKVLKVHAKCRTGPENFVTCIRKALLNKYGNKPVGLGGTFIIKSGRIKIHVMPDFSESPLVTDADVDNWLHFYTAKAPFMCLSTLVSCEPTNSGERIEHTHGYSLENNEGGHYHEDVTPDEIEYFGYYSVAEEYYRLDRPT